MFDIRAIRDNPEPFIRAWNRRKAGLGDESVAKIRELDAKWRAATSAKQEAESARNANSKLIGQAKAKKDEARAAELMALVADAKVAIETAGDEEEKARKALDDVLMDLPNLPLDEVPYGSDEHGNVEQHMWEPQQRHPSVNLPKDHADLGEALKGQGGFNLMDFEAAARMSGVRFAVLRGSLAKLERALAQFMLDIQTSEHGYEEVSPPVLVRDHALIGTGQLPKFQSDLFSGIFGLDPIANFSKSERTYEALFQYTWSVLQSIRNVDDTVTSDTIAAAQKRVKLEDYLPREFASDPIYREAFTDRTNKNLIGFLGQGARRAADDWEDNYFGYQAKPTERVMSEIGLGERSWLIPTSEVPLTNLVREQILEASQLPLRFTAHTPCFRSEAGSAGRDTKGMIRQHQFYKVELVSIVANEEEGLAELERMTGCAEEVLKRLELPFRRMLLCTGDMGAGARKTYDLEVWLPSQNTYREISSCSYCGDFQARRMDARYRPEPKAKTEFVHTLNGSGLAVGRTLVAVLENYQNPDGSITVPKALVPYMGGVELIK